MGIETGKKQNGPQINIARRGRNQNGEGEGKVVRKGQNSAQMNADERV
jgi:hypothetical protein